MKEVSLLILFSSVFLVGCSNNVQNDVESSVSETSTKESTIESSEPVLEKVDLTVFYTTYQEDDRTFTIRGKASNEVTVSLNGKVLGTGTPDSQNLFEIILPLTESEDTDYEVSDSIDTEKIKVNGKNTLADLEKQRKADVEKQEKKLKEEQQEKEQAEKERQEAKEKEKNSNAQESDLKLLDYQKEGMENAKEYPAKAGAMLYDKNERKFKGMNYYFEGEIIGDVFLNDIAGGNAWLVRNSEGYVMPVEQSYFKAEKGDNVKVWGTLSGLGYSNSDLNVDNVVGATGSMHAMGVEVNGEIQY